MEKVKFLLINLYCSHESLEITLLLSVYFGSIPMVEHLTYSWEWHISKKKKKKKNLSSKVDRLLFS